jgi:hypothetical protein
MRGARRSRPKRVAGESLSQPLLIGDARGAVVVVPVSG